MVKRERNITIVLNVVKNTSIEKRYGNMKLECISEYGHRPRTNHILGEDRHDQDD